MTTFDADELLARMRADRASDWPDRLLHDLAKSPLVSESDLAVVGQRAASLGNPLTSRETRALEYMSRGMGRKGTAELMVLSEETICTHLALARRKLGAKNTTQACCEALRQGLIR